MIIEAWVVEYKIPELGRWQPIHRPNSDADGMTEADADKLIAKYERAMPTKEYRKRSYTYGSETDDGTDDIPF